ncbi:MAG TPA: hypothetical protein VEV17_04355 [Bryobacteraceae bacterium]|nr:hypothetical protein [Bryobacteraceae bacterium]
MIKALSWCVPFLLGGLAFAQDPDVFDKAPPPIDEALRARVEAFYQAHVDGKFRKADDYVAEDSKDAFFVAEKPHYKACAISRINYEENFTKATVVTSCKSEVGMTGRRLLVTMPAATHWKLENGLWFWYYIPTSDVETPFGKMKSPENSAGSSSVTAFPTDPIAAAREILSKVTVEPASVSVDQTRSSTQEIHLKNGMPGPVSLSVTGPGVAGLSIKPAKTEVGPGEEVALTITFNFDDPAITCQQCLLNPGVRPPVTATIHVQPTNQQLPVQIIFTQPASNR